LVVALSESKGSGGCPLKDLQVIVDPVQVEKSFMPVQGATVHNASDP
jgi:hypothetical protein